MTTQYVDQRVVLDLSRWTRLAERTRPHQWHRALAERAEGRLNR